MTAASMRPLCFVSPRKPSYSADSALDVVGNCYAYVKLFTSCSLMDCFEKTSNSNYLMSFIEKTHAVSAAIMGFCSALRWEGRMVKRILLMNGPNLNMLGIREPGVYGTSTLVSIEELLVDHGAQRDCEVECFQSNHEGVLIDRLHEAHGRFDGIVYNPGAHTHYSYAIRDAIGSIDVPVVEVHISDVDAREPFRAVSVVAPACVAQVKGLGVQGYIIALDGLLSGWSVRLGEGFERNVKGKVLVGTPEGPVVERV